jgi:TolA-binding protein
MQAEATESSPAKMVVKDLEDLRAVFRETIQRHADRVDEEVLAIQRTVKSLAESSQVTSAQMRDLRDMITLLRNTDFKPQKGHRKDLKKIDNLVDDLRMLTEQW